MPRILVADDNSNIQKMVALAFQERGVDVTSVGNGEAAVRRLPDLNPDLVLADVFMPVRNGYEVCEFIKKDQRFAHIPVILLVGAFDPLDEKEARRVGADGVLKKPFVPPDPLIAMVLSALEKNPRVAAELAKAKEAAAAPPPPPPLPALEIAAKTEPKPLPDFPEPSAEEAAVIYGFGKGVRALDDEDLPKAAMEPKAPVAEAEEEEAEEADAKKDWRRSAMDFEMPDADAARPALSADEDLDAGMFPSERDVPPKHVRMRDVETETVAAAPVPVFAIAPSIPVKAVPPAPVVAETSPKPFWAAAHTAPIVADPTDERFNKDVVAQIDQKAAQISAQESEPEPMPVHVPEHLSVPEPVLASVSAPVSTPVSVSPDQHPAEQPKVSHWMDMMAPTPSGGASGDWMSALMASAVAEPRPSVVAPPAPPVAPLAPIAERVAETVPEPIAQTSAPAANIPSQPEAVASIAVQPVETVSSVEPVSYVDEKASQSPVETVSPVVAESDEPFFADDLVESKAPGFDHNLLITQPDLPVASEVRDPELEGPVAVRVIPEPDLVNDEPIGPSDYDSHPEETSPLHSFDVPAETVVEASQDEPVKEEPAPQEAAEEPVRFHSELASRLFENETAAEPVARVESSHFGASQDEWSGRIPTAPPPSREALSDIPFLMPPPPTQLHSSDNGVDAATVDAVVRKVLERIESQIHGILSQDSLKPLVEGLLENELAKKER